MYASEDIAILMATYNGEKYISQQIDSILQQTYQEYRLFICDDCSTDNTFSILKTYAQIYPEKITLLCTPKNSGSSKYNFIRLMARYSCFPYMMLCDQDDIWLPDKIELGLQAIRQAEKEYGQNTPVLLHTDLKVVDKNLQLICSSFKKMMRANYNKTTLNSMIVQNTITGCTAIYNCALGQYFSAEPEIKNIVMHDWWLGLIASAFGKIVPLEKSPILYRQHEKNNIGAKPVYSLGYKISLMLHGKEIKQALAGTYIQAVEFLNIYHDRLSDQQRQLLKEYASIPEKSKLGRIVRLMRLGTFKNGMSRVIAQLLFV